MNPALSIIIPCYNYGLYIEEAIKSIENYAEDLIYEIVIVNDGSDDPFTIKILNELESKGYNVIHQENKGSGARNTGLKVAKGSYIFPLDADDKIRMDFIWEGITILENNKNIDIIYGNALKFGEDTSEWKIPDFDVKLLLKKSYIPVCAVYRKEVWDSVGGYPDDMPMQMAEDWVFWLRALAKGYNFLHLDKIAFDYRIRYGSMSTIGGGHPKAYDLEKYTVKVQYEVLHEVFKMKLITSGEYKEVLQEIREKFIYRKVFHEKITKIFPEIFSVFLKSNNKLAYSKNIFYWFKQKP